MYSGYGSPGPGTRRPGMAFRFRRPVSRPRLQIPRNQSHRDTFVRPGNKPGCSATQPGQYSPVLGKQVAFRPGSPKIRHTLFHSRPNVFTGDPVVSFEKRIALFQQGKSAAQRPAGMEFRLRLRCGNSGNQQHQQHQQHRDSGLQDSHGCFTPVFPFHGPVCTATASKGAFSSTVSRPFSSSTRLSSLHITLYICFPSTGRVTVPGKAFPKV